MLRDHKSKKSGSDDSNGVSAPRESSVRTKPKGEPLERGADPVSEEELRAEEERSESEAPNRLSLVSPHRSPEVLLEPHPDQPAYRQAAAAITRCKALELGLLRQALEIIRKAYDDLEEDFFNRGMQLVRDLGLVDESGKTPGVDRRFKIASRFAAPEASEPPYVARDPRRHEPKTSRAPKDNTLVMLPPPSSKAGRKVGADEESYRELAERSYQVFRQGKVKNKSRSEICVLMGIDPDNKAIAQRLSKALSINKKANRITQTGDKGTARYSLKV